MPEFVPTDLVKKLAKEGKSEKEIASTLKSRGFSDLQVDKALKIAIKEKVEESGEKPAPLSRPKPPNRPYEGTAAREPAVERHPGKFKGTWKEAEFGKAEKPLPFQPKGIDKTALPENLRPLDIPSGNMEKPAGLGKPIERIKVPEGMKPLEVGRGSLMPAEVPEPTSAEIELEEIVEAIVKEKWKDMEIKFAEVEKHESKMAKDITAALEKFGSLESQAAEQKDQTAKSFAELSKSLSSLNSKISALETAFKEIGESFKKR